MEHEVVVGNIGVIYNGPNGVMANSLFRLYRIKSERGEGRAAGESVTWLKDGEVHKEHAGSTGSGETESATGAGVDRPDHQEIHKLIQRSLGSE